MHILRIKFTYSFFLWNCRFLYKKRWTRLLSGGSFFCFKSAPLEFYQFLRNLLLLRLCEILGSLLLFLWTLRFFSSSPQHTEDLRIFFFIVLTRVLVHSSFSYSFPVLESVWGSSHSKRWCEKKKRQTSSGKEGGSKWHEDTTSTKVGVVIDEARSSFEAYPTSFVNFTCSYLSDHFCNHCYHCL